MLKNLCAGRVASLRERNPPFPEAAAAFFDRAFADDIEERYASVADFLTAFERAADANASQLSTTPARPAVVAASEAMPALGRTVSARRFAQGRLAVATGAVLVAATGAGLAWRALAGSAGAAPASASHVRTSVASAPPGESPSPEHVAPGGSDMPPVEPRAPHSVEEAPVIPVSALPRADSRALGLMPDVTATASLPSPPPGRNDHTTEAAHGPPPVAAARTARPLPPAVAAPPVDSVPTEASAAPHNPSKPVDRSEVF
jgi:hypothetical protein